MRFLKIINLLRNTGKNRHLASIADATVFEDEKVLPYSDVPGPKGLPVIGNSWRFLPYVGDFEIAHIDKFSKKLYQQYGKIVKIDGILGRPDMIFLFDPDLIEQVFREEDVLPYRPSMPSLNYYKHVYRKSFFGQSAGVIAVHGESWQTFRSKVNQIMLQPKTAKMYQGVIADASQEFVDRIDTIRDEKGEVPENFLNEIHKWSLESIARVALDAKLGCLSQHPPPETQKLIHAVHTFFLDVLKLELKVPFWKLISTPTFREFLQSLDIMREICMKHINQALTDKTALKNSVLQKVLNKHDTETACNLALDMFLVGIDTTSNAVASILYQLAIHEDKQEELHKEIERFLPNFSSPITNETLEQMSYLKACIKETMRMYPVVLANGRCTTNDCIIGGYKIPKGVQVIFQHQVISNMDQYFTKSSEFLPERWLKDCPFEKNHHSFASLPFGFGKRMCLGKRFADLEIQTVLAKILQHYRIEYHHQKLDYHLHPLYIPNGPLKLTFTKKVL